jgi:glycosyltransferase involved in cell wall biosynthesis
MGTPKRKIVFTVINDLTYDQRMYRICSALAAAGYKVQLIGRRLPHSLPVKPQAYEQTRLRCYFTKGKFFYIEYNLRLLFYLLFKRFDILSAVDLDTLVPCFINAKLKGKPIVYDAHEYFTEVPEVITRPATKKVWEWVANTFIPKLKYCYTVGPMLAEEFEKKYKVKFGVIMNAPLTKEFPNVERLENVLLYQGALNKARGIEHYIDMMELLPGFELWLVGEGDLSHELRVRAKDKNVENRVRFFGRVEPENLHQITAKAYIGLNISENAGLSYFYSLNNKFFDHIHAQLPTVANKFPEYLRMNEVYNVMVFADANPQSVAAQVELLSQNKSLYNTLTQNCIHAKKELCWEIEQQKLVAFYNNVGERD